MQHIVVRVEKVGFRARMYKFEDGVVLKLVRELEGVVGRYVTTEDIPLFVYFLYI